MKVEEVRAEYAALINPETVAGDRQWKTMGDIAEVIGGGTPRTSDPSNFENGDIPWLTPADLSGYTEKYVSHGARFITGKGLESSSARLLPAGSVLFTSRAPIGYVAIARNPIATNQGFKSFVLKEGILPEYVYWWLKGAKQTAEGLASGTTFLELSGANAKKLPVPLVPLDQQKRIVAEIEKQFSRLDKAVANLKRVKANLKRYKSAVLKAAVEGRLVETEVEHARREGRSYETGAQLLQRILETRRSQWHGKKYKEPAAPDTANLPELPEGWTWCGFEQVSAAEKHALKAGPFGSALKKEFYVESGYKIYGQEQVISGDPTFGDYFIDEAKYRELESCAVKPGDLLISLVGTAGKVLVLPPTAVPGIINPRLLKLSLDHTHIEPAYAAYMLQSAWARHYFKLQAHGGTMEILNLGIIKALPVPLPPLAEQNRIVAEVDLRLSLADETERQLEYNLKRAAALRNSVLARSFSSPKNL
mgnify:CR=1 FL=1